MASTLRRMAPRALARPTVAIPCCYHLDKEGNKFQSLHAVTDKYASAILNTTNMLPISIPAFGKEFPTGWEDEYLNRVDGLLITGSPTNIHPSEYGSKQEGLEPFDQSRDATSIPLIKAAVEKDIPILAICRGFQELNVAMGGTLEIDVTADWENRQPPMYHGYPTDLEKCESGQRNQDLKYGPAHTVVLNGELQRIFGEDEILVNTCHYQVIDELGENLAVEALASDGVIEAVRIKSSSFGIAVQWHPEYRNFLSPSFGELPVEGSEEMEKFAEVSKKVK